MGSSFSRDMKKKWAAISHVTVPTIGTHLEEAKSLDLIQFIERETMVDPSGHDEEVTRKNVYADPFIGGMLWTSCERGMRTRSNVITNATYPARQRSRQQKECKESPRLHACAYVSHSQLCFGIRDPTQTWYKRKPEGRAPTR